MVWTLTSPMEQPELRPHSTSPQVVRSLPTQLPRKQEPNLDARVRVFLRIIEEQPGSCGLALKTTSKLLGLSQARLRLIFKLEIGKTLSQYLRGAKMAAAAGLVRRHALPIKAIAQQCGYDDVSNFYRDFKREHGMTPQQLRARHLDLLCRSNELLSTIGAYPAISD
jgi:AraC-like DNA-binding protein